MKEGYFMSEKFKTNAILYFIITLTWSLVFWVAAWIWSTDNPSTSILFYIGGAGPFVVAIVLTMLRENPIVKRDFWRRIFDPRLIAWPWILAALLLHPVLILMAFGIDVVLGGVFPQISQPLGTISLVFSLVLSVFILGPLPEEIGWRGFAFERLQNNMNAVNASLVLGSIWALWHVPLFFIPGTFHADVIGLGSTRFWLFLLSNVPLSVIITWVYKNTSRSTLAAAFVHFSGNILGALFLKTDRVAGLELVLLTITAVILVMRYGSENLIVNEGRV
jgi:membrane protease YdiL (CAAX protease family)